MGSTPDRWAAWLLERRHGGDEPSLRETLDFLAPIRERVLENAGLEPGDTLLDVGCGDGLIAFGGLERVGADGRVVFSDVSEELLDTCRAVAAGDERCAFVRAPATDLSPIEDESVDAVTTRSVLIYVSERERAFAEFFRVLRPGGRLSIFEPLNSFEYPGPADRYGRWDVTPVRDLADRVKDVFRAIHDGEGNTMHDFEAPDFMALAEQAGFAQIDAEAAYSVGPTEAFETWDSYENSSANPLVPTLAEAIGSTLTAEEAARFREHLRAKAEAGDGTERTATLYLWAKKAR